VNSKANKRRKKLHLTSGAAKRSSEPTPIVICLAASVAMLRKSELRNVEISGKPNR